MSTHKMSHYVRRNTITQLWKYLSCKCKNVIHLTDKDIGFSSNKDDDIELLFPSKFYFKKYNLDKNNY